MKDMNYVYMSTSMEALCRHVNKKKSRGGLRGVRGVRLKGGELKGGLEEVKGRLTGPATNQVQTKKSAELACHKQSSDKNIPAHNWACHKPSSKKTFLRTTGPANVTHTRVPSHVVM